MLFGYTRGMCYHFTLNKYVLFYDRHIYKHIGKQSRLSIHWPSFDRPDYVIEFSTINNAIKIIIIPKK
jgi:hypothetical protein